MIVLTGIAFYYANRSKQRRLLPWMIMVGLIAASTYSSSIGLVNLFHWVKNGGFLSSQAEEPPVEQNTAIGRLGELKLSRRIEWRLTVPEGQKPPDRVMTLAYNKYDGGKWRSLDPNFQDYDRSSPTYSPLPIKRTAGSSPSTPRAFGKRRQRTRPL